MLTVATLALAAAGCSDDEGGEAREYVDAVVAAIEDDDDNLLAPPGADSRCIAARWVEVIGLDELNEAAIEPDDFGTEAGPDLAALELDASEADDLYDSYEACGTDVRDALIDEMVAEAEDGEGMRSCVEPALSDEGLRAMMTAMFRAGADAMDEATENGTLDPEIERVLDGMSACVSADIFGSGGG